MTIRRFVIAINQTNDGQQDKIRKYLSELGYWWNWIPNFWLFVTTKEEVSTDVIIKNLIELCGTDHRALVMEFEEDVTWASFGLANAAGKKMTTWIESMWANGPSIPDPRGDDS